MGVMRSTWRLVGYLQDWRVWAAGLLLTAAVLLVVAVLTKLTE